ncbi:hypothetical protein [Christensenella intestinihominis]|uniref:hypothetical protein n=1 Tax=Christensenella intestinihominis TaxID=1851429 RepID=UPI0008338630|nr:hypothetical protein [Christensenella intestinihominis]
MKKFVVLTAVLLVTALGVTACAVPSMGKLEIVGTPEPAEAAAGEAEGEAESADQSEEAAAAPAKEPSEEAAPTLDQQQVQELVEDGIVPKDAVKEEDGNSVYDEQEVNNALQKYVDRISCKTTMISGNNMIVQVQNGNDVTIPLVTVHVNYPEGEKPYDFYQFVPGGQIIIPVEKGSGELPPAVTASVSVSMNANQYTDISQDLTMAENSTGTEYRLTITNSSTLVCQKISATVLFSDDSGIICAQMTSSENTIAPGRTVTLTFALPESMTAEGKTFTSASYQINEAIG